jgi:hypothetical protein
VRGQRGQLEKRPARVDQALDPLAREQLPPLPVAIDRGRPTARAGPLQLGLEIRHQLGHPLAIPDEVIRGGVEMTRDAGHGPKSTVMCG